MIPHEAAILRTVAYFDAFDYPPTAVELVRWLHALRATHGDVVAALATSPALHDRLASADGFWFLRGREEIVSARLRRQRIAERKLRRARRVAAWLGRIPGVRLVAVANTLALAASREEADIDLFVVTRPGMVWTIRAIGAAMLKMLRLRPGEAAIDPVCLSFIVSDDHLDLRDLRITDDIYFSYWIATLVPLVARGDVYERFWQSNVWIRDTLPNAWSRCHALARDSAGFAVPFVERALQQMQEHRFPSDIRKLLNCDTRVVATDCVLKFHTNDRRAEYRDRWMARCRELGV